MIYDLFYGCEIPSPYADEKDCRNHIGVIDSNLDLAVLANMWRQTFKKEYQNSIHLELLDDTAFLSWDANHDPEQDWIHYYEISLNRNSFKNVHGETYYVKDGKITKGNTILP